MITVSPSPSTSPAPARRWTDVSFEVKPAEIMGLLGHNGAGKSTVLGIMLGMVRPTSGEVHVAGHSVQRERANALRADRRHLRGAGILRVHDRLAEPACPLRAQRLVGGEAR